MKRYIAWAAVAGMLTAWMAGCGNSEGVLSQTGGTVADETAESSSQEFEDIADIRVWFLEFSADNDHDRIEAAVNEITESKIGVHANIEWIPFGSWNQQLSLVFSSNEPLDVITIGPSMNLDSMARANQLMDISGLLEEYAPETKALVEKLLPAATYGDAVYGIPKLIDFQGSYGITMNKDMLEDAGLMEAAENMSTWEDYEAILEAIHEAFPDVSPVIASYTSSVSPVLSSIDTSDNNFSNNSGLNQLGDAYNMLYVDEETNEVKLVFDTDFYRAMADRISDWYKKDLVYKDSNMTDSTMNELLNSGVIFSYCSTGEGNPQVRTAATQALVTNCEVYYKPIYDTQPTMSGVTMFGYAVPYTSTEPEAAMQFINLMYTDPQLQNLLEWGEEGTDYIVENGVATYPEGIDSSSVGYHAAEYMFGNSYIALPWEGKPASYNEDNQKYYDEMGEIPYFGCVIDTSSVTTELTACYNALLEFVPSLTLGANEDPQATIDQLLQRLNSSGIDKVIDCYQTQLDAWLAEQ